MAKQKEERHCLNCGGTRVRSMRKYCSKKCSAIHRSVNTSKIPKDELVKLYLTDRLESANIAKIYNVSIKNVYDYIKRYDMELRGSYEDLTDKKIGSILCMYPIFPTGVKSGKHVSWRCKCDCGHELTIISSSLVNRTDMICNKCARIKSRNTDEIKPFVFHNLQTTAKSRGLEFNVSKEYLTGLLIKQDRKCKISGVDIKFAITSKEHLHGGTTASLDRIDSSKGYIEDNVQWLHKRINIMKLTDSQEQFISWCRLIVKNKEEL